MTQKGKILLDVKGMTIGHQNRELYSGVDIEIREGECIMLCGANGSGKTTLLKALAGMKDQDIVMIPTRIPKIKGFTLNEFIQLSCYNFTGAEPEEAMFKLGLSHLTDRDISTLSDGEFQKGTIAAAIAKGARIILLDEPTAFLDVQNRRNVLATLRNLCEETGAAVIFSSHDLHESLNVCSKVIALGADRQCHISSEDLNATASAIFSKD